VGFNCTTIEMAYKKLKIRFDGPEWNL